MDYTDLLIVSNIPAVKEIARYLGRDICTGLETLRLKKTTAEWMKEVPWRDWSNMTKCSKTFPSLKRVVARNNEDVEDEKLARYVLFTFGVQELQVDVVEGD